MNITVLSGRLTKDVEARAAGESKVANFSLAVNRGYKREGQPDADFFDCVAWRKTAEIIGQYGKKGMKVTVTGSLQNDAYTDKDGNRRTKTVVVVNSVEFDSKPAGTTAATAADTAPTEDEGDEIPFV